jgi:CHASE1-domain containing sensor protein
MPVAVALGGVAVTLALFASVGVQERDHIGRLVSGEAEATARAIQTAVTSHIQALTRLEALWGGSQAVAVGMGIRHQKDPRSVLRF